MTSEYTKRSLVAIFLALIIIAAGLFLYFKFQGGFIEKPQDTRTLDQDSVNNVVIEEGVTNDPAFPNKKINADRYFLMGELVSQPEIDDDGFLVFKIKYVSKNGKESVFNVHSFAAIGPYGEPVYAFNKVDSINQVSDVTISELLNNQELTLSPHLSGGKNVALLLLIGKDYAKIRDYYDTLEDESKCPDECQDLLGITQKNLKESVSIVSEIENFKDFPSEVDIYSLLTGVYYESGS